MSSVRGRTGAREHRLKCWPDEFGAILAGSKRAEYRKADRDFKVGDVLILEEWHPGTEEYTGCREVVRVTHIVRGPDFGIPEGYVVMSIRESVRG